MGKGETERAQQGWGGRKEGGRKRGRPGEGKARGRGWGGRRMVGGKQGWVTGGGGSARTGRRSVVVRITAKRHRPIFLPFLPSPSPRRSYEASTCFPSVPRVSGLQFAALALRCPLLRDPCARDPSLVPSIFPLFLVSSRSSDFTGEGKGSPVFLALALLLFWG